MIKSRAGITDATQIAALENLYASAIANGWWDKCDLIYPFVGGTAVAHAQNLKTASFEITWVGGVTHDANGVTGNGTTGFGRTGYIPASSGQWALNSAHMGAYIRSIGAGANSTIIGSTIVAGDLARFGRGAVAASRSVGVNEAASASIAAATLAFNMGTRLDNAAKHLYFGATDTSSASASVGVSTVQFYVLALNNNNVAANFSSANVAAITAGSAFTLAEYALMRDDWQTFQTSLGRNV